MEEFIFEIWSRAILDSQSEIPLEVLDYKTDVLIEEKNHMRSKKPSSSRNALERRPAKQIKILATLVPDFIIECDDLEPKTITQFLAVLLFADISGFTKLTQKCSESGEDGMYKLTAVVNSFLGEMVGSIYEHGGDVYQFGGDSFLALWKVNVTDSFGHIIHKAIHCALDIQKNLGNYKTPFNLFLNVKIGMSAGNIVWCVVGEAESLRCILAGEPVKEVKRAERACKSGDVVVSASLWGHVSSWDFFYEVLSADFIKVIRVLGYFGLTSEKMLKLLGAPSFETRPRDLGDKNIRPLTKLSQRESLMSDLRACVLSPVVQQVHADLSLEFLTEMRILTIMFINVTPKHMLTTQLIEVVDKAYKLVRSLTHASGGLVDKVSLQENDIQFLVVFGLRGIFPEGQVATCLNCGYDIREGCLSLHGVKGISIGVTTGLTYCGIVGHELRKEFTMMGPAVNKAARIITAYPGNITCDLSSQKAAKLPTLLFPPAPYRAMRGFSNDEEFFHFNPDRSWSLLLTLQAGIPPLLGRRPELEKWRRLLHKVEKDNSQPNGIFILGESGIGKSRLMDEMISDALRQEIKPCVLKLSKGHTFFPLGAAVYILSKVVSPEERHDSDKLKKKLLALLANDLTKEELTYVDFIVGEKELDLDYFNDALTNLSNIFCLALKKSLTGKLLAIDDADMCDQSSWQLLMAAVEAKCSLLLLTMEPNRNNLVILPYMDRYINLLHLQPLSDQWISPLACQFLKCNAIEVPVAEFLKIKSFGNPGACRGFLLALRDGKFIDVQEIRTDFSISFRLDYPLERLLTPVSLNTSWSPPTTEQMSSIFRIAEDSDLGFNDVDFKYEDRWSIMRKIESQQYSRQMRISHARRSIAPARSRVSFRRPTRLSVYDFDATSDFPGQLQSTIFVPENKTTCDMYIEESVEQFISMKTEDEDSDIGDLDTLLRYRKKSASFSRLVFSPKASSENDDIYDDIEFDRSRLSESVYFSGSSEASYSLRSYSVKRRRSSILAIVMEPNKQLDLAAVPDTYSRLLSTFDKLLPYEQLFLKCASVLGQSFRRVVLNAILHQPDSSHPSTAIKKLFELKIINCMEAYRKGGISIRDVCHCALSKYTKSSQPKYASCQHMRFRSEKFRDTLYDLMMPNQKKMFHERAVKFLRAQPRKCAMCRKSALAENDKSRDFSPFKKERFDFDVSERMRLFLEALLLGPVKDFSGCRCTSVEKEILLNLLSNCQAAQMMTDVARLTIEFARLLLRVNDSKEARKQVNLALVQLRGEDSTTIDKVHRKAMLAESELLLGELEFEEGDLFSAMRHIINSLILIEPHILRTRSFSFRPNLISRIFLRFLRRKASPTIARSLNFLTFILMRERNFKGALIICLETLEILRDIHAPVEKCTAFGNLVDITLSLGRPLHNINRHEAMLRAALEILPVQSLEEAVALSRITHAIYLATVFEGGSLTLGIRIIEGLERLCHFLPMPKGQDFMRLEKFHLLLLSGNHRLAKSTIAVLRRGSSTQQLWFHSFNLDVARCTGQSVYDLIESKEFVSYSIAHATGPALHRGIVSLLLSLLETDPDRSVEWQSRELLPSRPALVRSLADVCTRCDQMRAFVLQRNLLPIGSPWAARLSRCLHNWITDMQLMTNWCPVLAPMYYYLMAYVAIRLEKHVHKGQKYLYEAQKVAEQQGNVLMINRIINSRESWTSNVDGDSGYVFLGRRTHLSGTNARAQLSRTLL